MLRRGLTVMATLVGSCVAVSLCPEVDNGEVVGYHAIYA
ncbi:hypothetical protein SEA_WOOPER_62 [Gordonia phage Wooper]|nr:hypothetical protein SEA_WOOPER_62 [Gordonia phage Wooper]